MNLKSIRFFITAGAISGLSLLLLTSSHVARAATEGQNITASPTSVEHAVDPGGNVSGSLSAINDGTATTTISISVSPYGVTGEDYKQSFQQLAGFGDASKWFTFDRTKAVIASHSQQQIPYEIHVPQNTAPGGYYAAVFFETAPQVSSSTGIRIQRRVGVLFYIRVNGAVSEQGEVASWRIPFWQTEAPLTGDVRLANNGNIHFASNVNLVVKDVFGNTKFTTQVDHFVLPKTIRDIQVKWDKVPNFGIYRVSGSAIFLGQTEKLSEHFVLVMSQVAFLEVVGVVGVFIILLVLYRRVTKR